MSKFFLFILIAVAILNVGYSKEIFNLEKGDKNEEPEEIAITGSTEIDFRVKENISYVFSIEDDEYLYSFTSTEDNIFYIKTENESYELIPNETFFARGERVYVNHLKDLHDTAIKISPLPLYNELNSFETINDNQYFFIKSENDSIVYFDSFDKNSKVYISESRQKKIFENDIRINGKFHKIEPGVIYFIKNQIFGTSVFKKYFYPLDLDEVEIDINGDEKNFFYLVQNKNYIFNFKKSDMNKIIKLSSKTLSSRVKIIKNGGIDIAELHKDSPYYTLDKNYEGNLELEVYDDDAFIEFIYNYGDYEVLTDEKKENYNVTKNTEIIKIPFTFKSFVLKINSNANIKYSLALGLTNNEEYYYSSNLNTKIDTQSNEETLSFLSLFKNVSTLKDEFLSLTINFEKSEDQEILISYKQFSDLDLVLDEKMEPEKCKEIIKAIQETLELYVYLDIAQNPPDVVGIPNYHHRKINLTDELGNMQTENRTFYEFYQEIKTILSVVRDGHFEIASFRTPLNTYFYNYLAVIPIKFYVKEYNNEKRLFIEINENYIGLFTKETEVFLREHVDIPLKTINNIDPIDYIQNWSHYNPVKNINSKFVHNLEAIYAFRLIYIPLNYTDFMQNEYEFDDNKIIRLSYFIQKPAQNFEFNSNEFNEYLRDTVNKYKKQNLRILPSMEKIMDKYLSEKGIKSLNIKKENKKFEKESNIEWDIIHFEVDEGFFKCRVDHNNSVNVFVQDTFMFNYFTSAFGKILQCAKLFHSNNYPIIIIETKNGGGIPNLAYEMIQLFQMREVERTYSAVRYTETMKKVFRVEELYGEDIIYNPDTCKTISSTDELIEVTNNYDYNGLNISHKRSNVFVELNTLSERNAYNELRKQYKDSPNLKRPTDILIFTDGYTFSSGSTFVKGFQNIGGAILIGYSGNPKLEDGLFDASQSDSGVDNFIDTYIYTDLYKQGFYIGGLTNIEVFDDSYKDPSPIPREYTMIPVDERVDIYSSYSDEIYDQFIEKGKQIHKKFNEENYCNYNNKKLLLHDNEGICEEQITDEHAHGGFKCGENNQWDKTSCQAYYCDIGYSFDQYTKKCVKDCTADWNAEFIFDDEFSKSYDIPENGTLELFTYNPNGIYYVFESSEDNIENLPRISFLKDLNDVFIKNGKNSNSEGGSILKINSTKSDINIYNFKRENFVFEFLLSFKEKRMIIFQSDNNHMIFINNILNNEKIPKIKYAKYNDSMQYQDILDINDKYFKDYSLNYFPLEKNEIYIIYSYSDDEDRINLNINSMESEEISLLNMRMNYYYLAKGKNYSLQLPENLNRLMIKLSRDTPDSQITINDKDILSSDNLYYYYDKENENSTILKLNVEGNDAVIEFLYYLYPNIINNIDFEHDELYLRYGINYIKIPKDYKNITFNITSENTVEYVISQGYSISPYCHGYRMDQDS